MIINDHELGRSAAASGDFNAALVYFRAAIAADPDNWTCWLDLALALDNAGQGNAAERAYRHIAARCPVDEIKAIAGEKTSPTSR